MYVGKPFYGCMHTHVNELEKIQDGLQCVQVTADSLLLFSKIQAADNLQTLARREAES